MTDPFGQGVRPVNLSARQAAGGGYLTSGTFGLTSTTSSESAALLSSLESRLRRRTASVGSTLYKLTWKPRTTPAGRSISALRASVLRTSGKGSRLSSATAELKGHPTPRAADGEKNVRSSEGADREIARKGGPQDAAAAAALTGWPTATCADVNRSRTQNAQDYSLRLLARPQPGSNLATTAQALAAWPTATATAKDGASMTLTDAAAADYSSDAPTCSGWTTTTTRDWKDSPGMATVRPDGGVPE